MIKCVSILCACIYVSCGLAAVDSQTMQRNWKIHGFSIEIVLSIPKEWKVSGSTASDKKEIKKIEFYPPGRFDKLTLQGEKVVYRKKHDGQFEILFTESGRHEAEGESGAVHGEVYGGYVVFEQKVYLPIAFYDWDKAAKDKSIFESIVKTMVIRKIPLSGKQATVRPKDGLRVRDEPSVGGKVLKLLPANSRISTYYLGKHDFIDQKDGNWVEVGLGEWVFDAYLQYENGKPGN